ncbi:MAG: hypothetical protein J0I48_10590 [Devosia sp.]|uniref:hypothetical protein n=1 Tax=Devosia sp. 66-22 TaxID=1895753 RepID=UPI000927CFC1|nr:hypothetical protein [Devosia sp. 66-22]MBN9346628.1 hypothetical protein [Devosia sp.]OJX54714.1 MAG: hypothetical protein BGO81_16475 [Devosia sp. 66-22]
MTRDTVVTAIDAVQNLAARAEELERHSIILAQGTATQAATIRKQADTISQLRNEVGMEAYNVEFLKRQGRKTRSKTRALRDNCKAQAKKIAELEARLAASANRIDDDRKTIERQIIERHNLALELVTTKKYLDNALHSRELPEITVLHTSHPVVKFAEHVAVPSFERFLAVDWQEPVKVTEVRLRTLAFGAHIPAMLARSAPVEEVTSTVMNLLSETMRVEVERAVREYQRG